MSQTTLAGLNTRWRFALTRAPFNVTNFTFR
jgi:hypothetical protein